MLVGLQLAGTRSDGAALAMLVEAAPGLAEAPWSVVLEEGGPGSVLLSEAITDAWIEPLLARGLALATVAESEGALTVTPWVGASRRWARWRWRQAARLLEALRPLQIAGEPLVDEALFVTRPDSPAPRLLLERLLLLERGDAQVCDFASASGERRFAVWVRRPPVYLLMAARDGDGEVEVYARCGGGPLWVAWSYAHPLAERAGRDRELWFPRPVFAELRRIVRALETEDKVLVSDRKLVKLYKVIRTGAFLNHGGPVQHADLGLLAYVGNRRDELAVVASKVKALLGLADG